MLTKIIYNCPICSRILYSSGKEGKDTLIFSCQEHGKIISRRWKCNPVIIHPEVAMKTPDKLPIEDRYMRGMRIIIDGYRIDLKQESMNRAAAWFKSCINDLDLYLENMGHSRPNGAFDHIRTDTGDIRAQVLMKLDALGFSWGRFITKFKDELTIDQIAGILKHMR